MDSALFLLNSVTTSDGLCENQGLEEPVVPAFSVIWRNFGRQSTQPLCNKHLYLLYRSA
jgi:hypothetical protein